MQQPVPLQPRWLHPAFLDYWRRQVWAGAGLVGEPASYVGRVDTPGGTRKVSLGSLAQMTISGDDDHENQCFG